MESSPNDQAAASTTPSAGGSARTADAGRFPDLDAAIQRARQCLMARQHAQGYWCGELQGDTILESEYILLLAWLDRLDDPRVFQAARYLLREQLPQGGWSLFPGGEMEISASVKAYFALKLAGHDPRSEPLRLAREAILAYGGAEEVNSFTRFYLALLGQIPFDLCPAVLPEFVLLPKWSPINIYRVSAWSRAMLVPLSIVWAHRPVRRLPDEMGIEEIFVRSAQRRPVLRSPAGGVSPRLISWERCFRGLDRFLKACERLRLHPLRKRALRAAQRWMTDRFVDSDGLGAIFPPIVWSVMALKCLGYSDQSAEVRYCHEQLEDLILEEEDLQDGTTVRLQPCKSPVWDTALTLRALASAGEPGDEPAVARATAWLLTRETTRPGDWSVNVRAEPGGWYFEHHNAFYPDLDDTAMVLSALCEQYMPDRDAFCESLDRVAVQTTASQLQEARDRALLLSHAVDACQRARRWTLAMQNSDGGWGAFDKDNDRQFLCHVPFADHNAMIDPSTADLTGRVLEALALWGATLVDPVVQRAVQYLRTAQESDGSWYGRWGVNYIYGTWQCLVGLAEAGLPRDDAALRRGAEWLLGHQQPCGGWGESPESYARPQTRGQGRATPSQTAWALLGLLACGLHEHPAVRRGVEFLLSAQQGDGGWLEPEFTGTGFPRVFYLRYHMYPLYFPLLALGRYQQAWRKAWSGKCEIRNGESEPEANDGNGEGRKG